MSNSIKALIQQYRIVAPITGYLMPAATQTGTATLGGVA
jgi:hypothetical protein